jgi:hypothetical protein
MAFWDDYEYDPSVLAGFGKFISDRLPGGPRSRTLDTPFGGVSIMQSPPEEPGPARPGAFSDVTQSVAGQIRGAMKGVPLSDEAARQIADNIPATMPPGRAAVLASAWGQQFPATKAPTEQQEDYEHRMAPEPILKRMEDVRSGAAQMLAENAPQPSPFATARRYMIARGAQVTPEMSVESYANARRAYPQWMQEEAQRAARRQAVMGTMGLAPEFIKAQEQREAQRAPFKEAALRSSIGMKTYEANVKRISESNQPEDVKQRQITDLAKQTMEELMPKRGTVTMPRTGEQKAPDADKELELYLKDPARARRVMEAYTKGDPTKLAEALHSEGILKTNKALARRLMESRHRMQEIIGAYGGKFSTNPLIGSTVGNAVRNLYPEHFD